MHWKESVLVQSDTDVFVVGGGPAGLAAAIAAARKGLSVVVADGSEPPIDKACGEGMMPETQAALSGLGVDLPARTGWNFRGIRFVQADREISAAFPEAQGIGIRRPVLHQVLIDAAEQCGVRFLWKTAVAGIETNGVRLGDRRVGARWIIGADGATSRVRKWADLDDTVQRAQRLASRRHYRVRPWSDYMEIHWGKRAQAYVTPIANEEVCVVIMGDAADDVKFDRALEELPSLREKLAGAELGSRERGAVTVMHRLRRVARGNVALVGDASGGVDAITGEGLRLAFRQAAALAEAMQAGDLSEYQHVHRELQQRPLRMGKLMVQFGRREGIRERMMRAMSVRPELFTRMLAIHLGLASPREVVAASALLGWQFLAA
jgi:flavin-dependent dehydrogenase